MIPYFTLRSFQFLQLSFSIDDQSAIGFIHLYIVQCSHQLGPFCFSNLDIYFFRIGFYLFINKNGDVLTHATGLVLFFENYLAFFILYGDENG